MNSKGKVIIIPCYNEERRLQVNQILSLMIPDVYLILVNDGSSDRTLHILQSIQSANPECVGILNLDKNYGKAEAVRAGLSKALERSPEWVGYVDADFATPASEVLRLIEELKTTDHRVVLAARVGLLGTHIQRKAIRHYLGRIFAAVVSIGLNLRVYDTQCGTKFFLVTPEFIKSIENSFFSRWVFDMELISRLMNSGYEEKDFVEIPLKVWTDMGGSKLTFKSMVGAVRDVLLLAYKCRRDRRAFLQLMEAKRDISKNAS